MTARKWRHAIVGIIGVTGYGKTTFARKLLRKSDRLVVFDPQDDFDELTPVSTLHELAHILQDEEFRLAVRLENTDEYVQAAQVVGYYRGIDLLIDEANIWTRPNFTPEPFKQLIFRGRRREIRVVWTSQRPGLVSRDLSSQSMYLVTFRLIEPRDLTYLPSRWRNRAEELERLPVGEYRIIRGDGDELAKIFR